MNCRPMLAVAVAALLGLLLAGCLVGPDYRRPDATAVPAAYAPATNGWKIAEPQAHLPKGNWWELFGDAELNRLETDAVGANQDLKAAVARFEQARAFVNVAKSGLFPQLGASGAAIRERDAANRPVNGVAANGAETYNTFTVPLDFSYELDVWGRVRRGIEAAAAQLQANADDVESVKLGIEAEVAADYFALRALDSEYALLTSTVEVLQKSLALTQNRRGGGVASDLDVSEADTLLRTTEAQLPSVALQRVKLEHALAVLTGRSASSFTIAERSLDSPSPAIPVGLPSELLERRPDIAAAERRMAAANADIGVAKAAFFPALRLSGLGGLQSVDAGTLFDWPSRFWAVGPSLTMPLFEGGRLRANVRQARAAYDEAVARYRRNVLGAFAEVEDNLAAQRLLSEEHAAETAALQSARKTLEIALNRYRAGLVTYLEVATAQATALDRERATVRLRGEQRVAAVALVKSLGGGWQGPGANRGLPPSAGRVAR
ncbi:MAG: efflux transporter outer membrane subunit [Limisphaerales bacterium]